MLKPAKVFFGDLPFVLLMMAMQCVSAAQAHPGVVATGSSRKVASVVIGGASQNLRLNLSSALSNISLQAQLSLSQINALTKSAQARVTDITPPLPGPTLSAGQQIATVLTNDWASWTGGANRPLTLTEVGSLMANPKITGAQAAVLGMIADQMNQYTQHGYNNSGINPSMTLAQIQTKVFGTNYDSNACFGSASAAQTYFLKLTSQIASSTNANGKFNLYGSYTAPEISTVQQGQLDDCYFVSAVNGVLNVSPTLIEKMIVQNANGTFTVSFPGGQKETVTVTDTEIAGTNIAVNNGCWLTVMGLAENKDLIALSTSSNSTVRPSFALNAIEMETPVAHLNNGGYQTQTLNLLTAEPYNVVTSGSSGWTAANVGTIIREALAADDPIGVDTSTHALTILGITGQNVTILNPWGISCPYLGFSMIKGVFTISTTQLIASFEQIVAPIQFLPAGTMGTITASMSHIGTTAPIVPTASALSALSAVAPPAVSRALMNRGLSNNVFSLANVGQGNLNVQTSFLTLPGVAAALPPANNQLGQLPDCVDVGSSEQSNIVDSANRSAVKAFANEDASVADTGEYCLDQADENLSSNF